MRFLLILSCLLLMSCAGGNEGTDGDSSGTSGKGDGQSEDLSDVLSTGYHFTISSSLTISEEGDDDPGKTFILAMAGLVFVESQAEQSTLMLRPCMVLFPEVSGRTPTIEPATVQNLPPVALDVELESAGDGVAMRTSSGVLLAGVALEDPAGDALPDHRSDDRLVDVDDDGRPGMSLLLDGFKVYTAMRIKMALEGSMESEGLISGHGSMSIEVGTYGDNVPFVNAANKADEAIEQLRVDDQEHLFVFRPVTESQMGCTDVEFSALHELPQDSTEPEPEAPSFPDPNE